MRVHEQNLTGAAAAEAGRVHQPQRPDQGRADAARSLGDGDRVELSDALGALSRALAADGSRRAARVQALAEQYQAGRYRPDSAATARALVRDAIGAPRR